MNKITTTLTPDDITLNGFSGNNWRMEANAAISQLVRLAKKNGNWKDFTQAEINKSSQQQFRFNELINYTNNDYILRNMKKSIVKCDPYMENGEVFREKVTDELESYSFTDKFILECKRLNDAYKTEQNTRRIYTGTMD